MWETAARLRHLGQLRQRPDAARIDPALTAIARSAAVGILLTVASVAIMRLRGPREITAPDSMAQRRAVARRIGAARRRSALQRQRGQRTGRDHRPGLRVRAGSGAAAFAAGRHRPRRRDAAAALGVPDAGVHRQRDGLPGAPGGADPFHDRGRLRVSRGTPLHAAAGLLGEAAAGRPWHLGRAESAGRGGRDACRSAAGAADRARAGEPRRQDHARRSCGAWRSARSTPSPSRWSPFYLWYRGIARCGVARTSICVFAEPLVATLFSLFVLRDAPADARADRRGEPRLGAIAVSARSDRVNTA